MAKRRIRLMECVRRLIGLDRGTSVAKKLAAIRAAAKHHFPTGDIGSMLREIKRGYGSDVQP
ncbi:MAG: hypothetical protein LAO09_21280 [Acidobacteriia bacterium]|nr:hypothetical protein [Terriglobia bacterium]